MTTCALLNLALRGIDRKAPGQTLWADVVPGAGVESSGRSGPFAMGFARTVASFAGDAEHNAGVFGSLAQGSRVTGETAPIAGDTIWVESHNAVTDEVREIKTKARLVEGLRPDVVAMSHHYGHWTHPSTLGGPTPNTLFYTAEGYVTNTADQTYHVKVRVHK